ncbi:MAG: LolA family protein, partial [Planctomycetota bacterium]
DGALMWRIIMSSPKTKLTMAAAAAVVVTLLLIVPFGRSGVTFAEVIQPILNAETVTMDMIVGQDEGGPIIHDIVKGSRIRRTSPGMSNVMILDLDAGRMLTFDPETKGAAYIDIQGPVREGTRSYLGLVREIVARLDDRTDLPVKQLGRQQIDGREAYGLQVEEEQMTLTIWADPETRMPVRIELLQGQSFTILKNIEFNVTVDDALVSMDVPPGYAVADTEFDMTSFSEEDFVETLRLWAELLLDGKFPDQLKLEDLYEAPIDQEFDQLDLSPEEHMQLGTKLARGYMFLLVLARGDGYTYAGKGVKLSDADKPIFWYRPQGSTTCRVIYGDLSARDVAPEDLPK